MPSFNVSLKIYGVKKAYNLFKNTSTSLLSRSFISVKSNCN